MTRQSQVFAVGDSVKVKAGTLEPDTEAFSIEGWQGRVVEIREDPEEPTIVDIEWDSITLRNMPQEFIEECEEEGLDWSRMGLYPDDLEAAPERDTIKDVKRVHEEIEDAHIHSYSWLGEEGKRIREILQGIDPRDDLGAVKRWGMHLERHLTFPFEAVVEEWQEQGPLRTGDRVKVKSISLIDDLYGVIVAIRRGHERFDCPLCELTAVNESSTNAQLLQDYRIWFANH